MQTIEKVVFDDGYIIIKYTDETYAEVYNYEGVMPVVKTQFWEKSDQKKWHKLNFCID
ncbi:hypothetical protein [Priestia filamentosa]|uniref:hypothetical protein n=1 Tax=Priestia filamentosa TaxID=1402861 RepID=UPI000A67C99B|nr:hypothetical protein [Priestia filamentosa]